MTAEELREKIAELWFESIGLQSPWIASEICAAQANLCAALDNQDPEEEFRKSYRLPSCVKHLQNALDYLNGAKLDRGHWENYLAPETQTRLIAENFKLARGPEGQHPIKLLLEKAWLARSMRKPAAEALEAVLEAWEQVGKIASSDLLSFNWQTFCVWNVYREVGGCATQEGRFREKLIMLIPEAHAFAEANKA